MQNVSEAITPSMTTFLRMTQLNDYRVQRSTIDAVFSILQRRLLKLDPWLPVQTSVNPNTGYYRGSWGNVPYYPLASFLDTPDAQYLSSYTSAITKLPSFGPSGSQRYPAGSPAKSSGEDASLRRQSDFVTTPLFTVLTTKSDGRGTVTLKVPQNLGSFVIRAYAATKGSPIAASKYGSDESWLLVRRTVSLTPSVPRIARVGDKFEAGVVVTAAGSTTETSLTVSAELINSTRALSLLPASAIAKTVTVSPTQQQQEVRFQFEANAIGNATIEFTISLSDSSTISDALQVQLPVLGKQGPVNIATSVAIEPKAGQSVTLQEGLVLPKAEPGSGSLDLLAGVGYYPAVQVGLPSCNTGEGCHGCPLLYFVFMAC